MNPAFAFVKHESNPHRINVLQTEIPLSDCGTTTVNFMKALMPVWIIIPFLLLLWLGVKGLDFYVRNAMKRSWEHMILMEEIGKKEVISIWRRLANNSVYGFDFKGGSGRNYCFEYEKGFDEYLEPGSLISKKSGEFRLTVFKNKDSATFAFKPRYCDTPFNLMIDKLRYIHK